MKLASIALTAAAMTVSGAAFAVDYTYTGALTAASPTFNRPVSTAALSGVGTAVSYATLAFAVTGAGSYNFLTTATGYDPFLLLYSGTFSAAAPLTNLLALNDDFSGSLTQSGFTAALTLGTSYTLVNTTFSNNAYGTFSTLISGPGVVVVPSPVPEPESYALMALGLAGIGAVRRRRSSRREETAVARQRP